MRPELTFLVLAASLAVGPAPSADTYSSLAVAPAPSVDTYPRQPGVQVEHYSFGLTLSDSTDEIVGDATVTIRFTKDNLTTFFLDFATPAAGKGMTVTAVDGDSSALHYTQSDDHLEITLARPTTTDDLRHFRIQYHGIPANGLRIGMNRYHERCFFSWNWPDKARQWLPTIDHPSSKATSEFIITAPAKYMVVANGQLQDETLLGDGRKVTHWKESVPIASWLNALGVEQFAVHYAGLVKGVQLETWVPHQDQGAGIATFEGPARQALEFFSENIGPFSYEKLASVSAALSGDRFGGGGTNEYPSAIFYSENVLGDAHAPLIMAHEIAHQWFGDAVTERDWDDVWLSEGFATYFALLFSEHFSGRDAFVVGLVDARTKALALEKQFNEPVVHNNISDLRRVNSQLVYQKGAWTLHMLRGQLGTPTFWAGIREYYRRYRGLNASSDDLRRVMEEVSGQDLRWFFDQWLHRNLSPALEGHWSYSPASKKIVIDLAQTQPGDPYRLPLELGIVGDSAGTLPTIAKIEMTDTKQHFEIARDRAPKDVQLDPNTWVLMAPPKFSRR